MPACRFGKAEFRRLVDENASAPPGERLTEADLLIDPGYDEMLDRQGQALCEEVRFAGFVLGLGLSDLVVPLRVIAASLMQDSRWPKAISR